MSMVLTKDQENAVKNITQFLSDTTPYYLLDGSAGTGKTHIMETLLSHRKDVILAAPTHKAAKVLSEKVGRNVFTIHKLLNYKMKYDKNGDTIFYQETDTNNKRIILENKQIKVILPPTGINDLLLRYIIVIDEASMISEELFFKLISLNNKILFVGDNLQLPPVNEDTSKVFSHVKDKSTLTEIVRTGDNTELANIHNFFRNGVKKVDLPLKNLKKLFTSPNKFQ